MAKKRQDNDLGDWGLILFLFVLGVWPVALFLMFTKLFGASENKRQTAPPLNQTAQSVKREGTKRTTVTPKKIMRSPAAKRSTAKWLQIAGVILLALGALATVDPIQMMLYHPEIAWWQTELLEDLANTMGQSSKYTLEEWNKRSWLRRSFASVLRLFAIWL